MKYRDSELSENPQIKELNWDEPKVYESLLPYLR